MRIGLIDVDGHHFPNLALMRISAYHKARGDDVEWWWSDFIHYDIVYMSKVFSDTYSPDKPEPMNADKVIKGGTGYSIQIVDGKEVFNTHTHTQLPPEIEKMFPDYSIYPEYDYAIALTSRGCPRGCHFCHVAAKEGRRSVKVADVKDFWNGQKEIKVLDPNILACNEKRELMRQYRETGAWIDFNQGIDIRLVNDEDIADLNAMKIHWLHFAWDDPKVDLTDKFKAFTEKSRFKARNQKVVYVLTNFNSTMDENLYRIYTLRDMGYDPYVMVYDKPNAPKEIRVLQRWVNNKWFFWGTERFEDFDNSNPKRAKEDLMEAEQYYNDLTD